MAVIDIFNGDADGICALVQLRNANPRESRLVTGVKRDISLVEKENYAAGDDVTVLDISLDKNREGVDKALSAGANVIYFDHHFAGDIPSNDNLQAHINTASDVCTSLLVNEYLNGEYRAWAVVGTFGDNLKKSAMGIAKPLNLSEEELIKLENLGIYINYNGYGATLEDLHFEPADLYQRLVKFSDPLAFMAEDSETFNKLEQGYQQDMASAAAIEPNYQTDKVAVFTLPNEAWARRVSGVYSNDLANDNPDRAHAVLTEKANGNYLVSVRAPLNNKTGADDICRQFPTGGGRKAAAGVNDLPEGILESFINAIEAYYA
ncbi:MAG: DHH family phosphoesterase [Porticoccaceae bacterium]|nr:acetyltransferase [Pseudomonadales bacterium]MCP5172414.1 DHH family phosphoesterase [Pseudomonadales bacterium]